MLSLSTKSFRLKGAVAALYAFCILLPAIAFALADGRMAPPCLMDDLAALSAPAAASVFLSAVNTMQSIAEGSGALLWLAASFFLRFVDRRGFALHSSDV